MIEYILAMNTNETIVKFVLDNMLLLMLVKYCLNYVTKKTPWACDDDLPSFIGGAIDIVKSKVGKNDKV